MNFYITQELNSNALWTNKGKCLATVPVFVGTTFNDKLYKLQAVCEKLNKRAMRARQYGESRAAFADRINNKGAE